MKGQGEEREELGRTTMKCRDSRDQTRKTRQRTKKMSCVPSSGGTVDRTNSMDRQVSTF